MKLRKVTSVIWPVVADFPADGGEVDKHHFWVKWKYLDDAALEKAGNLDQKEFLLLVIEGVGETQESVKNQTKIINDMVSDPYYRLALWTEYFNFRNGALEKNLSAWDNSGQT